MENEEDQKIHPVAVIGILAIFWGYLLLIYYFVMGEILLLDLHYEMQSIVKGTVFSGIYYIFSYFFVMNLYLLSLGLAIIFFFYLSFKLFKKVI